MNLPKPSYDRGTHYRVWHGGCLGLDSFNPFPGAEGYDVVSVPIGWSLRPDADDCGNHYGVLLVSLFGRRLHPQDVRLWGNSRHEGFRTVRRVMYANGPLDDDPCRVKVSVEYPGEG
jgi:hypothetical protein